MKKKINIYSNTKIRGFLSQLCNDYQINFFDLNEVEKLKNITNTNLIFLNNTKDLKLINTSNLKNEYLLCTNLKNFLPQNNKALSLINSKSSNIVESNNEINYLENIKKTNPGLKEHWNSLEDFRSYLNELEKEIDKHDRVLKFTNLKRE